MNAKLTSALRVTLHAIGGIRGFTGPATVRPGYLLYPPLLMFAAWFAGAGMPGGEPGGRGGTPVGDTPLGMATLSDPVATEVHDYAALACTALITWSVDARAGAPTPQPDVAPATARAQLVATYAYLAEASEQLALNLAELGRPQAPGGAAGASLLLAAADGAAVSYRAAETGAAELPLGDDFASARADLLATTRASVRGAFAGLPRLSGDQAGSVLDQAIASEPGCAQAAEAVTNLR